MAFTYGFYNSIKNPDTGIGDRRYDADQVSSLFDGLIADGVYKNIGGAFMVSSYGTNMSVNVASGRAWFDHTWSFSDSVIPISIFPASSVLNRIDAIVLTTNRDIGVRQNSIDYLQGTPASNPVRPQLTNNSNKHQHPLAYIYVPAGATVITQSNITNTVGTSDCPFVTCVKPLDDDNQKIMASLLAQWQAQWNEWLSGKNTEFERWKTAFQTGMETWRDLFESGMTTWKNDFESGMNNWKTSYQNGMETWGRNFQNDMTTWRNTFESGMTTWRNNLETAMEAWCSAFKTDLEDWNTEIRAEADQFISFYQNQWRSWYIAQTNAISSQQSQYEEQYKKWYKEQTDKAGEGIVQLVPKWEEIWSSWFVSFANTHTDNAADLMRDMKRQFDEWFADLHVILDDDVAAHLADRITHLEECCEEVQRRWFSADPSVRQEFWYVITDNSYTNYVDVDDNNSDSALDNTGEEVLGAAYQSEPIIDSEGREIEGRLIYGVI